MKYISEERLMELKEQFEEVAKINSSPLHIEGMLDMLGIVIDECTELNPWQPIETAPLGRKIRLYWIELEKQVELKLEIENDRKHFSHWQELPPDPL